MESLIAFTPHFPVDAIVGGVAVALLVAAFLKFLPWAVKKGFEEVAETTFKSEFDRLDQKVQDLSTEVTEKIGAVHDRIDSHMEIEEEELSEVRKFAESLNTSVEQLSEVVRLVLADIQKVEPAVKPTPAPRKRKPRGNPPAE